LIRLDRPAVGRQHLPLVDEADLPATGTPVVMIGHPTGLPAKLAPPGRVIHKDLPMEFPGGTTVEDAAFIAPRRDDALRSETY
jgi:hypothetical protein